MTERKKDLLTLVSLLGLLVAFFSRILFTSKIIRAPDITNEFYWGVLEAKKTPLLEQLDFSQIKAGWDIFTNSGFTSEGAYTAAHLLVHFKPFFHFMPAPASVAWVIVLHLFAGGAGLYLYCRLIGASRPAAFLAGFIFAAAPEHASLINAGHVMKIATISLAPWAFYFFECSFQRRRLVYFLSTGLMLAIQFFHAHWQIAYYTCLALAVYGVLRLVAVMVRREAAEPRGLVRIVAGCVVAACFFLSTVSISLIPITQWSKDTNRGVQSGSNQGKGGLDREEAMMWSLPPEELGAFVIPGFFGLSRQEGGANPNNIASYYWGRMVFTQTVSYFGLLPLLLAPLPLMFRRDRYTWIAVVAVVGSVLFSMGQYTPFYNFLYDHFPGINRFRVPKMMLFVTVMGIGVLAARGLDLLLDAEIRQRRGFRYYLCGIVALPVVLFGMLAAEYLGSDYWIGRFYGMLSMPNRFEQGAQLVTQRWSNLVTETGIAAGLALLCAVAVAVIKRGWFSAKSAIVVLFGLLLTDVWRINDKFMFLVDPPVSTRTLRTPVIDFLSRMPVEYRVLPMDGSDPMMYIANKIPVIFTSNPVQQMRWQEFLDNFVINSAMSDILNLRYVIHSTSGYQTDRGTFGDRFAPVFFSPDGQQVVLENRNVLPKAWLVPSVVVAPDTAQQLAMMQNPLFDPRRLALVESLSAIPLPSPAQAPPVAPGTVRMTRYEGENVSLFVTTPANALLVMGDKYYRSWKATNNGKPVDIVPVNHVLRGIYLSPGNHNIEYRFDPWSFKVGKWLTFGSLSFFLLVLGWEWRRKRRRDGR